MQDDFHHMQTLHMMEISVLYRDIPFLSQSYTEIP